VDILGDASPETFRVAIEKCIEDKNVDGLLVLFTPQYGSQPKETAQTVAVLSKKYDKPIFLPGWGFMVWMKAVKF